MDAPFKLLVVDDNTVDRHVGEECDLYKEVVFSPTRRQLADYSLFFRGIIRSAWNDVSKNIDVICDTDDAYKSMLDGLKSTMEKEEGITFSLN